MSKQIKEVIENWYFETNPESEQMSRSEIRQGVKAHFEEWKEVKDNYDSVEEYLDEVEKRGDWY